jgi:hypothetical protein
MGLRGPLSERRGAEEPPCPCRDQMRSKAVPHLDAHIDMLSQDSKSR